jgi:hypothetical protein
MISYVGDALRDCKLMFLRDASFAGDLKDGKATSGSLLCLVGPSTFCPLIWLCKRQGAVSHSSAEAEVMALDMALRLDGIPTMGLWEIILNTMDPDPSWIPPPQVDMRTQIPKDLPHHIQELVNGDYITPSMPMSNGRGKLAALEDTDACKKMCVKARCISMGRAPRVRRVDVAAVGL